MYKMEVNRRCTYTIVSGNKYVGEFSNNEFHGQGTYTFVGGNKYVGEFREGKPNGRGTHTFTDGRIKEGIWKDGKFIIDFLNGGDAYRRGVAAAQSGDFATAIREWTLAAEQGNAVAAARLGRWYRGMELRVGRKGSGSKLTTRLH